MVVISKFLNWACNAVCVSVKQDKPRILVKFMLGQQVKILPKIQILNNNCEILFCCIAVFVLYIVGTSVCMRLVLKVPSVHWAEIIIFPLHTQPVSQKCL